MLIKREISKDLKAHLPKKEMCLLVGPRQAGKTTLMRQLQDQLETKGEKTIFLSLDFERDQPHLKSQTSLIERLRLEFGKEKGYVFIDEIQRKENAGLFFKGIYDMQMPHKFILSGSGSVELKEKIHESLAGRKRIFELNTISLKEFIQFKTNYRYENRLEEYLKVNSDEATRLLMEYLNFGGYPRVIIEETLGEKIKTIDEIYRSYIEKDIAYLLRIERIDAYGDLIRVLAGQIGRMVNLNELSSTLGLSVQTVKNYLSYAEKTFIIRRVTPFFRNLRKEISKAPVIYFNDLGMRNFAVRQFGRHAGFNEIGFLFQNLVHHLLWDKMRYENSTTHYWRTKDKAEVDFVMKRGEEVIPVEVKCKALRVKEIGRSLRGFINRYTPPEAWVVNLSLHDEDMINQTKVKFIPVFDWLLL
jgi:hypothetical protein